MGAVRFSRYDCHRVFHFYRDTGMKKIDYRHFICIAITLSFGVLGVFAFSGCLGRIVEALRDFGLSVAYYFCEIVDVRHGFSPTVNDMPALEVFPALPLPYTWEAFQLKWREYWQTFADWNTVSAYFRRLGSLLSVLSKVLLLLLPFLLAVFFLVKRSMSAENNDYNRDSKPLQLYKRFAAKVCRPVKVWVIHFFVFIRAHKTYWQLWLFLFLLYFNAITIVLEFLAFYLYFVVSFDFSTIYRQIYKFVLDLSPMLLFIPGWCWLVVGWILFDRFRKKIGYANLRHYELRNRGFINARPLIIMVCGTMGKGKTTMITDIALSQEAMLRDKAFEKLLECDLKFPYFPWVNLENEIKRAMEYHQIYTLATCRLWARKKAIRWGYFGERKKLFDYDYLLYGLTYDDKLQVVDVWEVIETYTQLYFIYVIQSSLMVANYGIRTDSLFSDLGNFPVWDSDFFHRDSRLLDSYSRHAHILDFDMLRLGRKVLAENPQKDAFEFGVVVITEVGKERGNNLELREVRKNTLETNQKNDLFNTSLKMIRHPATVANFPFVRIITDEQRPSSWGADARDMAEIIHIREKSDTFLAMPFFALEELFYSLIFPRFEKLYREHRYKRGDNTLSLYLIKRFASWLHRYRQRIYNTFSYTRLAVQVESGTLDGQYLDGKYYLMSKKIYSKRFATDCYSEFFAKKSLRSAYGLDDLPEYATERATFAELQQQNSYFINDLMTMETQEEELIKKLKPTE